MKLFSEYLGKTVEFNKEELSKIMDSIFSLDLFYINDHDIKEGEYSGDIDLFGNFSVNYNGKGIIESCSIGTGRHEEQFDGWPDELMNVDKFEDFYMIIEEDEWFMDINIHYNWEWGFEEPGDYWTPPYYEPTTITDYKIMKIQLVNKDEKLDIMDELDEKCLDDIAKIIMDKEDEYITDCLDSMR